MALATQPMQGTPKSRTSYRDTHAISLSKRSKISRAYSRFVQILKLLLPVIAVLLVIMIIIWPHLRADSKRFSIGFSNIELSEAKDPSMINARYTGTDSENQPFSVTADIAKRIDGDTQSILLELPKADITLSDGSWLVLTSDNGIFDRPTQYLELDGAVNLFHDSGYEMHTKTAGIDLANGSAEGHNPVVGQGPFGRIESEGFRLIDKGKTIIFTGKTSAKLYLNRINEN
ncbi:LPS export ABC transporter periplasmic protein LptC [Terasakiella sp. A23]|uniref:LPS export ABC transporter periplasmic protein LptC n=1 Tax=Terasakiella sp. FCG-A23 TaxID=3080561 RepID=UPI00295584AB|nr:LPS export ABC transporter periplasmic protein LptC [Terasakiella sp. A23]MDV7339471.1 LPS export ABC transporter periplasmic protein LptC [Terasakiella sp. A23]